MQELLRPIEIKQRYKISHTTLLEWEKAKLLSSHKTPGGHRRYDREQVESLLRAGHEDKLILCQMLLHFDNYEPLPDQVKIVGMSGPISAAVWIEGSQPPFIEELDFLGIGLYRKIIPQTTATGWTFTRPCRMARLACYEVVLKGEKKTGIYGQHRGGYCKFDRGEDGTLYLQTNDLVKYLRLDEEETSLEVPGFFMAHEIEKSDDEGTIIRPVSYQLDKI